MDAKPASRKDTAAKPPEEGAEPKQRITEEKPFSDQQGDETKKNVAQQEQSQQQPQVPQPHLPLQSVLLPPRMPKHQRKISWDLNQELCPPSPKSQPQPQQTPPSPPPVSFRLKPKSSLSEQSSALSSSSPLQQPALYSPPNTSIRPDSAMTSSPFDLGTTTTGLSPSQITATGNGTVDNEYSSYNESPNSSNGSGDPTTSNNNMVSRASERKIDLGDLLKASPYESEAETYILSALEDRDPTYLQTAPNSRHRANTGFSSFSREGSDALLSRVPEESANMFLEEIKVAGAAIDTGSVMRSSRDNLGRGQSGSGSWRRSRSGSGSWSVSDGGQDDAGTESATNVSPTRTNTTASAATSAAPSTRSFGRNGSGVLQTGLTFHSESSSRRTAKPSSLAHPKHHRQATTTEETLQDLTNALDQVNKVANANHGADMTVNTSVHGGVRRPGTHGVAAAAAQPPLHHNPSSSGGIIPAPLRTRDASGSADALAHNANMLFQRKPKLQTSTSSELDVADSMHPVTTTPPVGGALEGGSVTSATRWTALKAAVWMGAKTSKDKKTDGDDGNIGDPPAGSISRTDVEQDIPDLSLGVNGNPADASPSGVGAVNGTTSSRRKTTKLSRVREKLRFIQDFEAFLKPELDVYCRAILYIIVPATGIAFILFYLADNPPTGRIDLEASINTNSTLLINEDGGTVEPNRASASWWILYVGVRQVITLSLARAMQVIIVDYFCLGSRLSLSIIGPMLTLLVVQARGWPFLICFWSIFDMILLCGDHKFAAHWLFFQDFLDVFNEKNPSGGITSNEWNTRILIIALCVGLVASVKRLWMGFLLGKKAFANYADDLASVMQKILLVSQVAVLARKLERQFEFYGENLAQSPSADAPVGGFVKDNFASVLASADYDDGSDSVPSPSRHQAVPQSIGGTDFVIDPDEKDRMTGTICQSQKMKIIELLGDWEEPEKEKVGSNGDVSVRSILQFRQSLTYMDNPFVFSLTFGLADTRENCIESSQNVYRRLLLRTPDSVMMPFETIAVLAVLGDGTMDQDKLKNLVRLFRPDRDGNLSLLDFVRSIDTVYKTIRLLRASVKNSMTIDRAFENIFNIIFYTVMTCVILSQIGFDPLALFLSLSSIILAFAFMIGSASSKYFEGLLFILLRRPYDIGDRIHISDVNNETVASGSPTWFVRDVTLFTTTVVFATTNERATLSNGSLAASRIINATRSPKALLYVYLKFGIEVPYERIQIFQESLTRFVKARPREWLNLSGFRATNIQADQGYIEYVVVLQHRDSWQNVVPLLVSKAQVSSFCLELSKKLDMRYKSPPLPVDLSMVQRTAGTHEDQDSGVAKLAGLNADSESIKNIEAMFEMKA